MIHRTSRAALLLAALAFSLTACVGGGGTTSNTPLPAAGSAGATVATSIRLVGVGDSLTAGEQSGGLFGLKGGIPNPYPAAYFPTLPNPALGIAGTPFATIPPTQGNGFWALVWSAANKGADPLSATLSPLPLMNGPVLDMLVPSTITGPLGGAPEAYNAAAPCAGVNGLVYTAATALQARVNPTITPFDLGIPGQTVHEALYQYGAVTSCNGASTSALGSLVGAESATIFPILGTFGPNVSQISAAVSLKPTVVTVWLGSNDLLKYALSGGAYAATDPASLSTDMVAIITQLQATGAKVAVANLFDVLDASYFTSSAELQTYMTLENVPALLQSYYLALVPSQGYLLLSGFLKVAGALAADAANPSLAPVNPNLVATDVMPGTFAASVQTYNDEYNTQIAAAATKTGAALVDVHSVYAQIYAGGGYPVNVPRCCSTIFGGGLTSLDGIHPSNTGYAIIANTFIQTLDQAYGLGIPPVNVGTIYATDPYAPH
jgi:lysophospholipase L1-like esterase